MLCEFNLLTIVNERTQEKHNELIKVRDNKKLQTLNLKAFISNLKCVDDKILEWNESVWMLLVKSAVVHRDQSITFKLKNEKEIRNL